MSISASRPLDVQSWFHNVIHEGYEKIPYRGRTGPGRREWWQNFQTWSHPQQSKLASTFSTLYSSINPSKKLDTARRILARMAELFQLVPWLEPYYREITTYKDEIADYEQLVSTVEIMFENEHFPDPNIVRRLVDRMAVMVRPKLFWRMIDKKKGLSVSVSELKEQWEIFVSAKMATHEFKDLFIWVFTMIDHNSETQSRLAKLKACKDVMAHSFSGPRTGVTLIPLRALSNNNQVKDKFAAVLGQSLVGLDLKGVNAKDDLNEFLENLVAQETEQQKKGAVMDVDEVPASLELPNFAPFLDGFLVEDTPVPEPQGVTNEQFAFPAEPPTPNVQQPVRRIVSPQTPALPDVPTLIRRPHSMESVRSYERTPQPQPQFQPQQTMSMARAMKKPLMSAGSTLADFERQLMLLQMRQQQIQAQFLHNLREQQSQQEKYKQCQQELQEHRRRLRSHHQMSQTSSTGSYTSVADSRWNPMGGGPVDPYRSLVNASPARSDASTFNSAQSVDPLTLFPPGEADISFFACPTPAPLNVAGSVPPPDGQSFHFANMANNGMPPPVQHFKDPATQNYDNFFDPSMNQTFDLSSPNMEQYKSGQMFDNTNFASQGPFAQESWGQGQQPGYGGGANFGNVTMDVDVVSHEEMTQQPWQPPRHGREGESVPHWNSFAGSFTYQ